MDAFRIWLGRTLVVARASHVIHYTLGIACAPPTTTIIRSGFAYFTILTDGEGKKGTDCLLGTLYFHVTRSSKNIGSSLIATRIWLVVSRSRTVTV